ncbi:Sodium/myo-inositol cotransporter [Lamellibrachia satsuma]|nr:Sodium/myo-inositol cotransporter [Lamellibrachia satsuma]
MASSSSRLGTWDLVAVVCYFGAVLGVGLYSMCRPNRGTVTGYFLAGRFMIWLPVGASLFASNIGSEHFIGLAGSAAAAGIGVGALEFNACLLLQLLGWVFLPVYIASGVCTLPEYTKKRFGRSRICTYLASLSLVLYIFTKISVNLYAGALFIQQALQWNLYVSVLLLLAATAFCTVTGGLAAVIYTDTLQALVMVVGATVLTLIGLNKVGGFQELYYRYLEAAPNATSYTMNTTCGQPRKDAWMMLRDARGSDLPWPGFLLGQTPASIWYWCTDQMMVQRALAAKSLSHAQGGVLFAGYIKLMPLFIMVLPGMISRVLYTEEVACADPDVCEAVCQNRAGCSNIAYPKLVLELMPTGLRGVMMSVMLAALMSDLTSIFNSASTLFTMDIYHFLRKKSSVKELMIVGRLFVCVMVVISIVWIPMVQSMQGGQLYIYIQAIAAYLAPPIAAVYLLAVLWKRGNEQGAFWALMVGLVMGVTRMLLDFIYVEPLCGQLDTRPAIVAKVHYMYFAMLLFATTCSTMVIISLLTKPPADNQLIRTTYWTRFEELRKRPTLDTISKKEEVPLQAVYRRRASNDAFTSIGCAEVELTKFRDRDMGQGDVSSPGDSYPNSVEIMSTKEPEKGRIPTEGTSERPSPHKPSLWRRTMLWFCGLDSSEVAEALEHEQETRVAKITSLKQDPRAKFFLNINAIFLVCITVFMYIFFSTGKSFGRF